MHALTSSAPCRFSHPAANPVGLLLLFLAVTSPGFTSAGYAETVPPSWELPPPQQTEGVFWRLHWYERGIEHGNPGYERRLRINPPEIMTHPEFGKRVEARENGLMLIQAEEDLFQITGAELAMEMWGGHPGTAGKRVSVNGRSTYWFPRFGAEDGHCTYIYPVIPLKKGDLVNGWNAFQLALDQGTTFWGHSLIDTAHLRVALNKNHPDLVCRLLLEITASVLAEPLASPAEGFTFKLQASDPALASIDHVDFQTWYSGYDENRNLRETDWHGFTKDREPVAYAGSANASPFQVTWDTAVLPAQKNVAVRAIVYFKRDPSLVYLTPATTALAIADHPHSVVTLYSSPDLPTSFWSRAGNRKTCSLMLDIDPARIERAELYVVCWTGGAGTVQDYFKLNGQHFPVAEGSNHVVQFNRLAVKPSLLHQGKNTIELLSDTEHHGIEVLYPGPALMVRYRTD